MNRFIIIVIVLFLCINPLSAQTSSVSISDEVSCAGREVMLNVNADDLEDVAAITLHISFPGERLVIKGVENVSTLLDGMVYNTYNNPPRISVAWSSVNPVVFDNTLLFNIRFAVINLPAMVTFDTSCEIAGSDFIVKKVNYRHGEITDATPVIQIQPSSITINEGKNAQFLVEATNAETYQWEISKDDGNIWTAMKNDSLISGVNSKNLSLDKVVLALNNTKYRCMLVNAGCSTISRDASLQVDSISSAGVGGLPTIFAFNVLFNTAESTAVLRYQIPDAGSVTLSIYSILGERIVVIEKAGLEAGSYKESVSLMAQRPGLYIFQLKFGNGPQTLLKTGKIVKVN